MSTQPEALRLADEVKRLNGMFCRRQFLEAAAELRRLHVEVEALRADAERYRWLKSRPGLELRSEKQPNFWQRLDGTTFSSTHYLTEGGTQHAPNDSLDAVIDEAMLVARERDSSIDAARSKT